MCEMPPIRRSHEEQEQPSGATLHVVTVEGQHPEEPGILLSVKKFAPSHAKAERLADRAWLDWHANYWRKKEEAHG